MSDYLLMMRIEQLEKMIEEQNRILATIEKHNKQLEEIAGVVEVLIKFAKEVKKWMER